MSNASPQISQAAPRYRGFSGAAAYGGVLFGTVAFLALCAGIVLFEITGHIGAGLAIAGRVLLLGAVAATAVTFSRWLAGCETDRLSSVRMLRGDWASLGFLAGLFFAGFANEQYFSAGAAASASSVGSVVDITGTTLDGGKFNLADHRGKVVVVDFWATWCRPCLAELPNMKALYEKHHGEGFEMVGVSLDYQRRALERFLELNPLPWPQIYEGGPGENDLARRFGINSIPTLLLIDRQGTLIADDLRGKELEEAVAHSLSGTSSKSLGQTLYNWGMGGVLTSPWWLLVASALGGTALMLVIELCVRRMLRRA